MRSASPSSTSSAGAWAVRRAAPTRTSSIGGAAQLSDVARKRLQAIFNASELGAGFQIALSDLEIRGAGNILGAEQHGHMSAVGFDLYTRMLAEAVEEQKAAFEHREPVRPRAQTVIDLPVDAYLPDDYVPEEPQKLELYRRLGRVATTRRWQRSRAELVDRFGALPAPVERLLEVARLRIAAEARGHRIARARGQRARRPLQRRLVALGGDARHGADIASTTAFRAWPSAASATARTRSGSAWPRDAGKAWETTRAIVERLANRMERPAA